MNEKDVMYNFISAPSKSKISKPWISFTEDRVVSTNGVVMLSAKKEILENPYNRWSSLMYSEPFANFVFGNISEDHYFEIGNKFYSLIEDSVPLAEKINSVDVPKITPVETTFKDNSVKFDLWQIIPIYNACIFWDKGFYMAHSRRDNCLIFKHATKDIEMAIKLLEVS